MQYTLRGATASAAVVFMAAAMAHGTAQAQNALPCIILGDSIAQGAAQNAPQCTALAKKGITSWAWLSDYGSRDILRSEQVAVVISLGSNDGQDAAKSLVALVSLRQLIAAPSVAWIAPGPRFAAREQVRRVAEHFGDLYYERPVEQSAADGVHFRKLGYERIAELARQMAGQIAEQRGDRQPQ